MYPVSYKDRNMINIYTFDVYIISGPMSKKFVEDNQVSLRKIEIRGVRP
jgi:hypothetical protein